MRFLHSFSLRLVSNGMVFATGLGNHILITRVLGPEGKGHYTLLSTTVMLLTVVFGEAISRSNAYLVGRDPKKLAPLSINTGFYGMAVVFFLTGIFFGGTYFSLWSDPGGPPVLWLLVFWVASATVLYRGIQLLFLGLERMGAYNGLPVFFALAYLIGNGIALKGIDGGLAGVMTSWVIAAILTIMLAFWFLRRLSDTKLQRLHHTEAEEQRIGSSPIAGEGGGNPQSAIRNPQSTGFSWSPDRRLFFRSMRFGLKAMLISLLLVLLFRVDVYLVRYFLGAEGTGIYSIAIVFAEMLQKIPNVAGTVLFSKIVAQEGEERDRLTTRVSRSIFVLTLIAAGGLALVGNRLIPLVFGAEFEGAYLPLLCMLPGVVAMASGSVINTNLWVQGYPPQAVIAPIAAVCTNVVLNLLLIPRFGLIGAGVATSAAYILWAGLLFAYFSKKTSLTLRELVMVRISDFGFRISD
ncbi:MAG: polysaccharide biosynthesis C-terminal domain-containing protein [Candidatus Latescibacteria bacterium]|nr:polysaccharide biosynthesis C-terminal domain-containing protein [Candidatus Latescibacterota bacterium]